MNRRQLFGAAMAGALSSLLGKQVVEAAPEPPFTPYPLSAGWLETRRFDASMPSFDKIFVSIDPGVDGPNAFVVGEHLPGGRIRILETYL